MTDVAGKTVIVTGASKGLGRSMSLHLSERGANVVLVSRTREDLEAVADEAPNPTVVAPADIRDAAAVEAAVESALEEFGSVDALINNAALDFLSFGDERKPIVETTEEEWDLITGVNLKGVFLCSKYALEPMIEQGSGNVINISSGMGRGAKANAVPYATTKWGVEGFTRGLALEVDSSGINVNALDPGGQVDTRIWSHLPDEEREQILSPDVMDDAAELLVAQGPDGVTGKSMTAQDWERRLD